MSCAEPAQSLARRILRARRTEVTFRWWAASWNLGAGMVLQCGWYFSRPHHGPPTWQLWDEKRGQSMGEPDRDQARWLLERAEGVA